MSVPPLFAFAPNWRYQLSETLGYATSVVQAVDGTEYRQGLRSNPRTVLSYTYTEHGERTVTTNGINANMWRNHADVVVCPYWPDGQPITLQSGPGFVVPTISGREFEVGGYVAAIKPDGSGAVYTVTNIVVGTNSTAIATNKSDLLVYGPGDMLYPAYEAEVNGIIPSSRNTASVVEYQISVELFGRPQKENGIFIYRNKPVLQMMPNRVDPVPTENIRMLAIIESITGRAFRRDQPGREFVARTHDYLIRNRAELATMRSYLSYMQGRLNGFWCPNWQRDLELIADTPPGGDALNVRRIDYDTTYANLIGRTDVAIKLKDGNVLYREIRNSVTVDATTEQIETFPDFGGGLFQFEVGQISWLDKVRLASDEITIIWETAEVCRVSLPLRGTLEGIIMSVFEDIDWRRAVIAASTANVTISSPGATMDGVTLNNGDRVLLRAQTNQSQNGIYVWESGSVSLTRADDANASALMKPGTAGIVLRGATYGQHIFFLDTIGTIDLGTTNLEYSVYDLRQVLGSNSVDVTGRTLSVKTKTNSGLDVDASGVSVGNGNGIITSGSSTAVRLASNPGLEFSSGQLRVRSGNGIVRDSAGVNVALATNSGLETDTSPGLLKVGEGNGISVSSGLTSVRLSTSPGLEFSTGQLQVKSGDGITRTSNGTEVRLATDPGLEFSSSQLRVRSGNGIERTSSGTAVRLATDPGLEFSSSQLRVRSGNGIERTSSGTAVRLATNPGLEFSSNALRVFLASDSGLERLSTGVQVKATNGLERKGSDAGLGLKDWVYGEYVFPSGSATFTLPSPPAGNPVNNSLVLWYHKAKNNTPIPSVQVADVTAAGNNQTWFFQVSGKTVTFGSSFATGDIAYYKYIPA